MLPWNLLISNDNNNNNDTNNTNSIDYSGTVRGYKERSFDQRILKMGLIELSNKYVMHT